MRLLLTIIILSQSISFAKEVELDTFLVRKENEILKVLTDLRSTQDEAEKEFYNLSLQQELEDLLTYPGVMEYPFEKWTTISTIKSPDGAFRLFNWNIESQDLVHSHYCYLVKPNRGDKPNIVYTFKEDKITLEPRPQGILTPDRWYGALYYKIIPIAKGNKTFYTVLGFSGKDRSTNVKLLDVFYFKGKTLRMGYPLFQESRESKTLVKRVFFQYSEKALISLNVNDKIGGIVFDHLVPEQETLEGMYEFYIPDMTYDCYKWIDGIWKYEEDVIAYNDPNMKIKQWHPTNDGETSEYDEVKDFWINPVDPNSPVQGGNDATAPVVDVRNNKDRRKKDKEPKTGKPKHNLFEKNKKPHSAIGDPKKKNKKKKK
ncbi:MAG: hypothetical protein R2780_06510 [Crocinitomicaceae bacterium]|nr:hypothetical protein [Crocinitomicaceae bacterium]